MQHADSKSSIASSRGAQGSEVNLHEAALINDNAGWCWYQDDRVIVDHYAQTILCATVANLDGAQGASRDGNLEVTAFCPRDHAISRFNLCSIRTDGRGDDHNGACLWQRPDGRYLAMGTGHNYGNGQNRGPDDAVDTQPLSFCRVSTHPHETTQWEPLRTFVWPSNDPVGQGCNHVTYSNLLHLSAEGGAKGRLYNIVRAAGQTMHIATSDDWGDTWEYRGLLSVPPAGGRAYSNGYFKFASNGVDRIDFIATEAHPRDYNTGIYHGYIHDGRTFNAAGDVVDPVLFSMDASPPEAYTALFAPRPVGEYTHHHAWTTELKRDREGRLSALFTTRFGVGRSPQAFLRGGPGETDHRLFFAELQGGEWQFGEVARMGPGLHIVEEDYTGLATIDPANHRRLYVSTPIDPRDGKTLKHHEIFCGQGDSASNVWNWHPITSDSTADNLRPQLAVFEDRRAWLLWLYGLYKHQIHYDQLLLAIPLPD